jgi:hypothetical protein
MGTSDRGSGWKAEDFSKGCNHGDDDSSGAVLTFGRTGTDVTLAEPQNVGDFTVRLDGK